MTKNKNIFTKLFSFIENFFVYIFLGVKTIFSFLFIVIKYFLKGFYISISKIFKFVYKCLDIFLLIITKYLFNGIYIFIKFVYKYILKTIFEEVKTLILSIYKGFLIIFKYIFVTVPTMILHIFGRFFMAIYKKIKVWYTQVKEFLVDLPSKIKNYVVEKYNNLAVVKHYRNKRERELEVLYIDKNSEDAKRTEKKHTYEYLARNQNGKLIRGYFSALSKLDTHSYLLDEGYEVYEIKTSKMIDFLHGESQYFSVKMSQKDLIFWLTQLSTYIKSGIPLTDSVKILSQQNKKKKYKKAFDSIVYELTMGESFSEALRKQNSVFPALLINMIKAAEMIGDIEGTLDDMAIYYSELEETRKSIVSAMMYPSIILVFSIIVVAFIMIYIIPQFVDVYTSSNIELNALTQTVINISDFIRVYYIYIVLFIVGFSLIYIVMYKNIKAFRTAMQYIFMHIPVVSKIIIYKEMNLFAKTFAALNKNNILLTDSIEILSKITGNEIYKMIMYDTISNLLRGDKMSDSFKNNWAVPQIAYFMITTGESTGELSNMLEKVSDYYQKEQKNIVNIIKSFIEPLMIALLAVIVGIIILAIIIPMFGLYSAIQ